MSTKHPVTQTGNMPRTPFQISNAAITDVGTVREINEDNFIVRPQLCLWAVADGMGGHTRGDFASETVVKMLAHVRPWAQPQQLMHDVVARLEDANITLQNAATEAGSSAIGSTVICMLALDTQGIIVWAGDSRAYRVREYDIEQLSKDHSVVEDLVDAGLLKAEEAEDHPHAHVLTRAVGAAESLELDFETISLQAGDRYLLCSDGLTRVISDSELLDILSAERDCRNACRRLIDLAIDRGASDNVTAVVVVLN